MKYPNNECKDMMSAYIATLIHDLKTPVAAQITAVNLLLQNTFGKVNDDQREILTQIKESCEYSQKLIHTILDTYLYENGQLKITPEKFNWDNLIDNAIGEIVPLAKNKEQKIVNNNQFCDTKIFADKFQLKRVIVNLISNAIKYGFNDSTIEVETKQDKENLILNVKSFSKYIHSKNMNSMYEKFQTDGKPKNSTSSGLGLYLVKKIIDAHNGKVFAKCEKNGECTFGFKIPRK